MRVHVSFELPDSYEELRTDASDELIKEMLVSDAINFRNVRNLTVTIREGSMPRLVNDA